MGPPFRGLTNTCCLHFVTQNVSLYALHDINLNLKYVNEVPFLFLLKKYAIVFIDSYVPEI